MSSDHIYTKDEFISYGNRFHFNTVIGIFVNGFAAYIVLKYSTKAMGFYKYYILLTIFCAFLMDFHISFIFGPFLMLPAPLICGSGVISRNMGYFWGSFIQYGIMHITVSCVGCSIVAGLLYQLASLNGNLKFFHSIKGVIIIFAIMICYPFPSFALKIPMQNFEESAEYIKEFHNNVYDLFISASTCHAISLDFRGKAHYAILISQVFLLLIFASIIAFKIHRKLGVMKNILSPATQKARRQLLIALCLQLIFPSVIVAIPLVFVLLSIAFQTNFGNSNFNLFISDISIPLVGLHSLANACLLMFIITPYRKAVINIIKKILRIKSFITSNSGIVISAIKVPLNRQ